MTRSVEIASQDTEALLLGRMLNSLEDRKTCSELIKPHFFFFKEHRIIFESLAHLQLENKPSEIYLTLDYLKSHQLLDKAKGADYVIQLAQTAPSPIHLQSYIAILKNHWVKREILEEVKKLSSEIHAAHDMPSFLEQFTNRFNSISKNLSLDSAYSFAEISALHGDSGYLSELKFRRDYFIKNKKAFVDGVPTGYSDLDETIGGFGNSNLIIIASRPGMGKTALALNFASRIAPSCPLGFISLEMSSIQLYERMLSMKAEVAGDIIREGKSNESDWKRIQEAEPSIAQLPIFIQEGGYFLNDLTTKVRHLKEEKGIKLLIIDYLQLLRATGETRLMEVSNITRDLKNLAMELHIPIVCLAQLSRKVEERTNHKPLLSDLRESGSIEQDADVVMFLVRQDYYDKNEKPGEANLIIAKNRHGKTGEVSLHFSKNYAKFEPLLKGDFESDDLF